ncbi:MAG: ROK family protein [Anaerolineae bacterium]|nr:ROK family protein [Anaerolineae bacterium]
MTDDLAIGVDIGGTKIAFALVNRKGEVLAEHRLPTVPVEGAEAVFDRVADGVHELLRQTDQPVAGVGIGCPGHLNPITGVIHNATNLAWHEVPLKEGVMARLKQQMPVWVLKDANASALGEMYFGAARGCSDFVYISLGTGLGGGAIVGGHLVQGGNFAAMEIGHMPFTPTSRKCACGMYGCPEMYLSGTGILAGVREHLPDYPDSSLSELGDNLTTGAILEAARANDPLALAVMAETGWWLCSVMICLMGILNPTMFVVGGGMGHAAAEFIVPSARKALRERTVAGIYDPNIPIVQSQVMSSAVGAACQVWSGSRSNT